MALSQSREGKQRMGPASHLLTPEEPTIDSFEDKQPVRPIAPRSPPESPALRTVAPVSEDPVLYPGANDDPAVAPLFGTTTTPRATPEPDTSSKVSVATAPVAKTRQEITSNPHWISVSNYPESRGAIGFVQRYNADPVGYWRECMAHIEELKRAKLEARKLPLPTALPTKRDSHTLRLLESLGRSRVTKPSQTPSTTVRAGAGHTCSPTRRSRANKSEESSKTQAARRHSRQTSTPANLAAQPKPRTRQPPSKVVEKKDQLWTDIPDYCPPIESLDQMEPKLRCEWGNKNMQDIGQDPDLHHLHIQERMIASTLRLKCEKYLQVKRLIFQEKVKFLKENKEFNKTSAQNCASVDVNKVSKLWQSFNDVGWFDRHWFEKYLD